MFRVLLWELYLVKLLLESLLHLLDFENEKLNLILFYNISDMMLLAL